MKESKPYTFIDLFAGCGGLSEGFLQSGDFDGLAHVEWELPMVKTLRHRLEKKKRAQWRRRRIRTTGRA